MTGAGGEEARRAARRRPAPAAVLRASDLLGCAVYDVAGMRVGVVRDLRLSTWGARRGRYRLVGLECGAVGLAHRLRGAPAGPWPLSLLRRGRSARSLLVAWEVVDRIRPRRIDLACRRDELQPARGGIGG